MGENKNIHSFFELQTTCWIPMSMLYLCRQKDRNVNVTKCSWFKLSVFKWVKKSLKKTLNKRWNDAKSNQLSTAMFSDKAYFVYKLVYVFSSATTSICPSVVLVLVRRLLVTMTTQVSIWVENGRKRTKCYHLRGSRIHYLAESSHCKKTPTILSSSDRYQLTNYSMFHPASGMVNKSVLQCFAGRVWNCIHFKYTGHISQTDDIIIQCILQ